MKKLIMRIRGGLGNQLFILGYGLALADNCKEDIQLICDKREYEYYKIRNYELDNLNVSEYLNLYNPQKSKNRIKYEALIHLLHVRNFFVGRLKLVENKSTWLEKLFGVIYKVEMIDLDEFSMDEIFMYGYFVDANSLLKIRHRLQYLFDIKDKKQIEKYLKWIDESSHTIAISLRLGQDYVKAKWPICNEKYYLNALDYIKKENSNILVFSDDIEKAKIILKGLDCNYVSNCSAPEQLALMSRCDDFVISNSTFSWWGAFLGQSENRIICSPEYWHTGKTTSSKLYYKNMHIIQQEGIN